MKFHIPTNMHLIIEKLMPEDTHTNPEQLNRFVWGYNTKGSMIYTGILMAFTKTVKGIRYTIEPVDDSSMPSDVDHIILVPDGLLPYVVDKEHTVYRIATVNYDRRILTSVLGTEIAIDDVQPVEYQATLHAKVANCLGKRKLEPELPNRCHEEGV